MDGTSKKITAEEGSVSGQPKKNPGYATVEPTAMVMRRITLEWFGHVKSRDEIEYIRAIVELNMEGSEVEVAKYCQEGPESLANSNNNNNNNNTTNNTNNNNDNII